MRIPVANFQCVILMYGACLVTFDHLPTICNVWTIHFPSLVWRKLGLLITIATLLIYKDIVLLKSIELLVLEEELVYFYPNKLSMRNVKIYKKSITCLNLFLLKFLVLVLGSTTYVIIGVVYRPPNTNIHEFNEKCIK